MATPAILPHTAAIPFAAARPPRESVGALSQSPPAQ